MQFDTQISLVKGSDDMRLVPESNTYWEYYWMLNEGGSKVPVAIAHVQDALKRGFVHTDKMVVRENPSDNVRFDSDKNVELDSNALLAKAIKSLSEKLDSTPKTQKPTLKKPSTQETLLNEKAE